MSKRSASTKLIIFCLFIAAGALGWRALVAPQIARAQQGAAPPAAAPVDAQQEQTPAGGAIKAETREVRVDVVVTDKKGNYVQDLTTNDFRLYEDEKQQFINSFSFGADPNAPVQAQRHYLVLFFDNSSMDLSDQPRARASAGKFIDAYAGPDRVMAIVNFGGSLQIVQNFTSDTARLKEAVSGISSSAVSPNASASNGGASSAGVPSAAAVMPGMQTGFPGMGKAEGDFGAYTLLLSIRELAKGLADVPGRKSLVLFTAGFALSPERMSELTATIDACNRSNVAVYPLDVRGLVTPLSQIPGGGALDALETSARQSQNATGWTSAARSSARATSYAARDSAAAQYSAPSLQLAAYHPAAAASAPPAAMQHGGGGGGGGGHGSGGGGGTGGGVGGTGGGGTGGGHGGSGGGGTGGGHGGVGGAPSHVSYGNPNYNNNAARQIIPAFPSSASTNQQVMYALASGTGGFTIMNSNDLMNGLEKIAREQNEYYLLGYTPPESPAGSCHTLKVKLNRGGMNVRARSGFCNITSTDPLAGKPIERELESRAAASGASAEHGAPGATAAGSQATAGSLEAPFFYTSPSEARVHLTMEVAPTSFDFEKVKGKYHADVNVLGIAYRPDGTVASRFSDEVTLDMDKGEWEKFLRTPMHYENQFSVAPGQYRLSVVLNGGGEKFAKFEVPLAIDPYDTKKFSLSAVALSDQMQPVSELGGTLDAELLADRAPLLIHNLELTPSGSNRFKKTDPVVIYAQMYAPQLGSALPPALKCTYLIVDPKSGKIVGEAVGVELASFLQKGNPVVPFALHLPLDGVAPGEYLLKVQGSDSDGIRTQIRTATFVVE